MEAKGGEEGVAKDLVPLVLGGSLMGVRVLTAEAVVELKGGCCSEEEEEEEEEVVTKSLWNMKRCGDGGKPPPLPPWDTLLLIEE